jgi:hypothetical protein
LVAPKKSFERLRGIVMKTSLLVTLLFIACTTKTVAASIKGDYEKDLFHDRNQVLGETTGQPWALPARKLEPGLRVLFAVGVKADGSHSASQPAIVIVK